MSICMIGLDTAKTVFQIHGVEHEAHVRPGGRDLRQIMPCLRRLEALPAATTRSR